MQKFSFVLHNPTLEAGSAGCTHICSPCKIACIEERLAVHYSTFECIFARSSKLSRICSGQYLDRRPPRKLELESEFNQMRTPNVYHLLKPVACRGQERNPSPICILWLLFLFSPSSERSEMAMTGHQIRWAGALRQGREFSFSDAWLVYLAKGPTDGYFGGWERNYPLPGQIGSMRCEWLVWAIWAYLT